MTREQLIAGTYPIPWREGDRDCHLRLIANYVEPPLQTNFVGPRTTEHLRGYDRKWRSALADRAKATIDGGGSKLELEEFKVRLLWNLDVLKKAIEISEDGWEIYAYYAFLAVRIPEDDQRDLVSARSEELIATR